MFLPAGRRLGLSGAKSVDEFAQSEQIADSAEIIGSLIGRGPANIRLAASAIALRDMRPELNPAVRFRKLQLLRVGIRHHEFHPRKPERDHVIDRIGAAAANANHRDARREIGMRRLLDHQVQGHGWLSSGCKR